MKWVKIFVYLVMVVLVLRVIKSLLEKMAGGNTFFFATILISIQFLLIFGFLLFFLFSKIFSKSRRVNMIALGAVLILFVSLELIFAHLLNNPQKIPSRLLWSFKYYYDRYDSRLIQFDENCAVYDSGLFYTLKHNAEFKYSKREFSNTYNTNSQGLRDDENSLKAPQIICLGDSYAMGWGVEQAETYAQNLEKQTGMTVLNAAISSYGTAREMLMLDRIDTSQLKYLVIQYCGNDRGENNFYTRNDYKLEVSPKKRYDSLVADGGFVDKYFPMKYFSLISQAFLKHEINKLVPLFQMSVARDEPIGNEQEHANAFIRVLQHSPINFQKVKVIVMMVDRYTVMQNNFLREVETLIDQSPYKEGFAGNLQLLDLSNTLLSADYYKLDLHINASGHRKIAQKLWEAIREP